MIERDKPEVAASNNEPRSKIDIKNWKLPVFIASILVIILITQTENPTIKLAEGYHPAVYAHEETIQKYADMYDVDPNFLAIIAQIESCGDPYAQSPSGAYGPFQVMPWHLEPSQLATHNYEITHYNIGEQDALFNTDPTTIRGPETMAQMAAKIVATCEAKNPTNDPLLTFACYNGGESVFYTHAENWYDETHRYVYYVEKFLGSINNNQSVATAVEEWMNNGGSVLCESACDNLGLDCVVEDTNTQVDMNPTDSLPSNTMYTIMPGDTLYGIAERHDCTVEQLIALNGILDPDYIQAGQIINTC